MTKEDFKSFVRRLACWSLESRSQLDAAAAAFDKELSKLLSNQRVASQLVVDHCRARLEKKQ